jgi:glycosyltransferase involved in cell wall biosynthesis
MAVFNALDFDGRVQRSAEALAEIGEVKVLALDGGRGFVPKGYDLCVVPTQPGEFGGNRWLHARFLRYLIRVARSYRPSVVYGHDFFMTLPAWFAAKLTGARFIYDAHELIIPGALGGQSGGFRERFWYQLEHAIVGRADLVIAANAPRAGVMAKHYRLRRVPTVIRNITAAPSSLLKDDEVLARYPSLMRRSPAECLCIYQGDVSLERGLGVLIDAFDFLPKDYRLLIVGGGSDVDIVRTKAQQAAARERINVLGRVPRDDLFDILRMCDVGVVTYSFVGFNNMYCAPNKVFEYAQGGIPVVATGQPPLKELVGESGIGCIAGDGAPPSPKQMADAILNARTYRERYKSEIDTFLAGNQWQSEAQRLQKALYQVIGGLPSESACA